MEQKQAIDLLLNHPAAVGRACGFTLLTDELHGEWMKRMLLGDQDMTLLAHRGSYKTTCVSIVLAIRMCLYMDENIIFFRKGEDDVVEIIRQTRGVLLNEDFRILVDAATGTPPVVIRTNATEITTDHFRSPRGGAQLLGIGIGGSITGKHADIIFTDDIVNTRDRVSRAERERTKAVYMELQNIRNRGGRLINTGTPWHKEDAISLMPNVERHDCYSTGLIEKDKLQELRISMAPSLFAANYELQHIASEHALFDTYPQSFTDPALLRDGVAHIDASYGGGDYTAFTCAKRVKNTLYLYGKIWHKHVDLILGYAVSECKRLKCAPVYAEINADKGYLAKEIRAHGGEARMYTEKENKYIKISTYLRKWWKNIVFLDGTYREYIGQIMDYTEDAEHDDAPDSAAVLARLFDRRGG